jgi:hypothetical protein
MTLICGCGHSWREHLPRMLCKCGCHRWNPKVTPKPKYLTKAALIKALEAVPDDAIAGYFSGDESTEYATIVIVHDPRDPCYFAPEGLKTKPIWFELGRSWS